MGLCCIAAASGCGGDGAGGAGASSAGHGGAGTSGAAGAGAGGANGAGAGVGAVGGAPAAGGGGGGTGDAGAGEGGSGGSGGATGGAGGGGSTSDPDLTLGGFNQDLPAPTTDCLAGETPLVGCLSASGEHEGEPFDIACGSGTINVAYVYLDDSRRIGCRTDLGGGDELSVGLKLGQMLGTTLPSAFEADEADVDLDTAVFTERPAHMLATHFDGDFELADTHIVQWRIAGTFSSMMDMPTGGNTWEVVEAAFALTLIPKPDCTPDGEGFGCDEIRLRGTVNARARTLP